MTVAEAVLAARVDESRAPFFAQVVRHIEAALTGQRHGVVDEWIEALASDDGLSEGEAERLCHEIVYGDLTDDEIGSLLILLQPEILPASTIAAFARVLREAALDVHPEVGAGEVLGDTCGTGSDTMGTFNVSTTIMFVLAAAGIKIAKHGNRAATSQCGSADVLEALNAKFDLQPALVERCIKEVGIGFMFAPVFHRAVRNVQRIRQLLAREMPPEIQRRTIFNVLGPLANPAGAHTQICQILGVYSRSLVRKLAEALSMLGVQRALVVFGECDGSSRGFDEFSTAGRSFYAEVHEGRIEEHTIMPEDVGLLRIADPSLLRGGDKSENAATLVEILEGRASRAKTDLVLLNAGAGLYIAGKAESIRAGVDLARQLIESGAAREKLEAFIRKTQELSEAPAY